LGVKTCPYSPQGMLGKEGLHICPLLDRQGNIPSSRERKKERKKERKRKKERERKTDRQTERNCFHSHHRETERR